MCITTDKGKKALGDFARQSREAEGLSIRELCRVIEERTGFTISPPAISDLEKGMREPQWNTLAKLVTLGYIKDPRTGTPYEVSDLFKIACEALDPATGETRTPAHCNV